MPRPFRESLLTALWGVRHAVRTQRNLRIHLVCTVGVATVGLALGVGPLGAALLVALVGLVVAAELVNTSLEALVDALVPDRREEARVVKDVAAAAVLVAAFTAAAGGVLILGPPLLDRLRAGSGWVVPVVLGALAVAALLSLGLSRPSAPCYTEPGPSAPHPHRTGRVRREERV